MHVKRGFVLGVFAILLFFILVGNVLAETIPRIITVDDGEPACLPPLPGFERGDANKDGSVDLSDGVAILGFLFQGGASVCIGAADVNDDKKLDITDAIYTLNHLFLGGPAPKGGFVYSEPGLDFCDGSVYAPSQKPIEEGMASTISGLDTDTGEEIELPVLLAIEDETELLDHIKEYLKFLKDGRDLYDSATDLQFALERRDDLRAVAAAGSLLVLSFPFSAYLASAGASCGTFVAVIDVGTKVQEGESGIFAACVDEFGPELLGMSPLVLLKRLDDIKEFIAIKTFLKDKTLRKITEDTAASFIRRYDPKDSYKFEEMVLEDIFEEVMSEMGKKEINSYIENFDVLKHFEGKEYKYTGRQLYRAGKIIPRASGDIKTSLRVTFRRMKKNRVDILAIANHHVDDSRGYRDIVALRNYLWGNERKNWKFVRNLPPRDSLKSLSADTSQMKREIEYLGDEGAGNEFVYEPACSSELFHCYCREVSMCEGGETVYKYCIKKAASVWNPNIDEDEEDWNLEEAELVAFENFDGVQHSDGSVTPPQCGDASVSSVVMRLDTTLLFAGMYEFEDGTEASLSQTGNLDLAWEACRQELRDRADRKAVQWCKGNMHNWETCYRLSCPEGACGFMSPGQDLEQCCEPYYVREDILPATKPILGPDFGGLEQVGDVFWHEAYRQRQVIENFEGGEGLVGECAADFEYLCTCNCNENKCRRPPVNTPNIRFADPNEIV